MTKEEIQRIEEEISTKPIFQAVSPDGHRYVVYPDGRAEGFPDGSVIFNMAPFFKLGWIAIAQFEAKQAEAEEV